MKPENLLHQTFNQLTAIGIAGRDNAQRARWLWRCSCGQLKLAAAGNVKNGHTRSCGCLRLQSVVTHGAARGYKQTPEYGAWGGLRGRVSPNFSDAVNYSGRGITVCEGLGQFETFLALVGMRPTPKHSVDRIDNDGNYSCGECSQCVSNQWPMNIRWATRSEQNRNKRVNRMLTFKGQTMCVVEWAELLGFKPDTLYGRLQWGWSTERLLTEPVRQTRRNTELSGTRSANR